jgi:hypothetical protein
VEVGVLPLSDRCFTGQLQDDILHRNYRGAYCTRENTTGFLQGSSLAVFWDAKCKSASWRTVLDEGGQRAEQIERAQPPSAAIGYFDARALVSNL